MPPYPRNDARTAERAILDRRDEIKMLCGWHRRPKGYSDADWLRALADSCRLGYKVWKDHQ